MVKTSSKTKNKGKKKTAVRNLLQNNSPHKSFHRTYREDYARELNVPGMGQHIYESFKWIIANYKVFLPLLVMTAILESLVVYLTSETMAVFTVLIFLMIWLTVIFLMRQKMAKHDVGLRDALYNSMTPLISSLVVFVVIALESIPIFLVIIFYSAAVQTDFLSMPFYALLFLGFAGLMLVLSGYLLSSSIIAFVAVSAPGLYPITALITASELMMGRRIRFILRLIALILVLTVVWAVIIVPLSAIKIPMEVLSIVSAILGCFSMMYITVYLYLYYRWMLEA